jgi:hypothetical protein
MEFGRQCAVIGVVHVRALPGSAGYRGNMDGILDCALAEARIYKEQGVDGIIVENMHDLPYLKGRVEPETTAAMAVVARAVKQECGLPTGVQVLAGANLEALGVAVAAGLDFLRVEGYVYAHVGDEGIHESCAAELMRRRANLKADNVLVLADIKKKHAAHAITEDVGLIETARAAEFFGADGVIVTGISTGHPPDPDHVRRVSAAVHNLVMVGSGVTAENVHLYVPYCHAVIVGSTFKENGSWKNRVDPRRVHGFVGALDRALRVKD